MECNYDEDLNENAFFQALQNDQAELLQQAALEGWLICVPRVGSLPKYALTDDDFLGHILVPSDELPESHFRTLNDREVRVCNRSLAIEAEATRPFSVAVLFEETFYTDDLFKYKVLCVESPLEPQASRGSGLSLVTVLTLRDCIDLLWSESLGKELMEQLDRAIHAFQESQPDLENESLQTQIELVRGLFTHCMQITQRDVSLREKTHTNKHLLSNVRLAVETYMQHGIYRTLIKGITASTAQEDSQLNKIIRNSQELQLADLEIRADLHDVIPVARQELSRVEGYSTVLGKVGCLRRAVAAISGEQLVCADDVLPVLVFLVTKVAVPNWLAHLTMMRHFRFSSDEEDELSFLVTSLEAAIEHVRSGCLFEPSCPEAQREELATDTQDENLLDYFYRQIKLGNADEVRKMIDQYSQSPCIIEGLSSLCHPLCSCDKCEAVLSKNNKNRSPSARSVDATGLTPLHVASKHGQLTVMELLILYKADINARDLRGRTPLHLAAASGHQNAMLFLLHANAPPDPLDNDGNTPLHLSSSHGHEACVKALLYFSEHLGRPVRVEARNVHGDTPLHHASRWGFLGIAQLLLEHGAGPELRNNRRVSPTDCAHSVLMARQLASLLSPPRKGGVRLVLPSHSKVAAASKSTLDFSDSSSSSDSSRSHASDREWTHGERPRSQAQCKKVIFGPMFSGKTTELIRRMKRYQVAQHRCLVFKYAGDTRYDTDSNVATHDEQKLSALSTDCLLPHRDLAAAFDVLGIDEGQFFPDTVAFCELMADQGKMVVVAALDGTYQRKGFGNILELVPLAESVEKLSAVCMVCFRNAAYTKRIGAEQEVLVIGGADKYMAVCRQCHRAPVVTPSSPFKDVTNVNSALVEQQLQQQQQPRDSKMHSVVRMMEF